MKKSSFCFTLSLLVYLSIPMTLTAQTVDIPDPNLRAIIESTFGKASGDPITAVDMETLIYFDAKDANISDLTGLQSAANLTYLFLWDNSISDLSPLAGLISLQFLDLQGNSVSDLSPVMDLTNLIFLGLRNNSVSDLSPLVANTELGEENTVHVKGNLLNYPSIYKHIPTLQSREVEVFFDSRTPTTLSIISGDNQSEIVDVTLGQPFVVEVRDENGAVFEGVPVTFTVTAGGSSLSDTRVDTDANGLAQTTLTLGSDPGTNTVEVNVEGITETATFNAIAELLEFDLSLPAGISMIHVPLKVRAVDGMAASIESVADLYDALGGTGIVNWLITYDPATQKWFAYFGDVDDGSATDRALTDDAGVLAGMLAPASVRLGGDALDTDGMSSLTLHQGVNLVGLPLRDSRITRVSDLFTLEGITDNIAAIIVSDNGEFKFAIEVDDEGDIPVTGGQSFILIAHQAGTVTISGDGWVNTIANTTAAPPMVTGGIQVAEITPVLALTGSIVGDVGGINSAGLRVTVKNLSTPVKNRGSTTSSAVATVIEDTAGSSQVGYRLTVVDIAGGRAAAIGDTLEISVTSPDAAIGVEPLRYTVTAEDVRRSRIQLPVLSLQEIPSETVLLRNYPNPFNPETWIPYRLVRDAFVTLTIYDGSGRVVRTLDVGHRTAGVYEHQSQAIYWDGRNDVGESVASGVYFYHLSAGDYSATRKMVILK